MGRDDNHPKAFLIPAFVLIFVICAGCPPMRMISTPPTIAVQDRLYYADGQNAAGALTLDLASAVWLRRSGVEHGRIVGLGKYLWLWSFQTQARGMPAQIEAVNRRLLAVDRGNGRVVHEWRGVPQICSGGYIVLDDGRVFSVDAAEEAGRLPVLPWRMKSAMENVLVAGDRLVETTTREEGRFTSIARVYELPSCQLRWELRIAKPTHGEQVFAVEGDRVAMIRTGQGGGTELVGIDGPHNQEVWRGDAEAVAWAGKTRGRTMAGMWSREQWAPLPGQLVAAGPWDTRLNVATGKLEKRERSAAVAGVLAEGRADTVQVFPQADMTIVARRLGVEEISLARLERDGSVGWEVKVPRSRSDFLMREWPPTLFRSGEYLYLPAGDGATVVELGTGAVRKRKGD